jgi:hypothetical protein
MNEPFEEPDPFAGIGKEDGIRKPERWTWPQAFLIWIGIGLMTLGGLLLISGVFLSAYLAQEFGLNQRKMENVVRGAGFGLCVGGYGAYRVSWKYRRR